MQNSLICRYRQNGAYRDLVDEVRNVAVFLRKLRYRNVIDAACPVQHHRGQIALALDNGGSPLKDDAHVKSFESDHAELNVMPEKKRQIRMNSSIHHWKQLR
jgi:hypothetical protein